MKDFEQTKAAYIEFRTKIIPVLMSVRPKDVAHIHAEQDKLEPWLLEALEHAADLESFESAYSVDMYEKPESKSWEFCKAKVYEITKWRKKAEAAAKCIESRSIKLSQSLKIMEGR